CRHALRLLQERAADGRDTSEAQERLRKILATQKLETRQLRALWALYALGSLTEDDLLKLLDHSSEHLRSWAVRLLCDSHAAPSQKARDRLTAMAAEEPSPKVRLSLASAVGRIPIPQRMPILTGLAAHGSDVSDANLPLMIW